MQESASAPMLKTEAMALNEEKLAESLAMPASSGDPKARAANLWADPKMRELKHFMRSHLHEQRLRESAELETRPASSAQLSRQNLGGKRGLRSEGCQEMDSAMKTLSKEEATLPYIPRTEGLPASFRPSIAQVELEKTMDERLALLRRMDRFQTRLTWRDSMDHGLKRLLIDMELSRDDCLKQYQRGARGGGSWEPELQRQGREWQRIRYKKEMEMQAMAPPAPKGKDEPPATPPVAPVEDAEALEWERKKEEREKAKLAVCKSRCEHLDKIYHWYETHGMKEVRKERKGPPYLKFNSQNAVMPGSLRVAPQNTRNKSLADGKGHSSSSPALLAGGSAAVDGGQLTRGATPAT